MNLSYRRFQMPLFTTRHLRPANHGPQSQSQSECATLNRGWPPASTFSLFHKPAAVMYVLSLF
jgi:hypothetical protein